jgi:uncharacterized Zn-binding protein involved in type VI secretion
MPAVTRLGDICTGHGPCAPRPNNSASPNVFVNGIAVHRKTDTWEVHCTHGSFLESGDPTVLANFLDVARIGDPVECGSAVAEGSPNVFTGNTAGGPVAAPTPAAAPPVPAAFKVPPLVLPPAEQARINRQTAAYVANPGAFAQNPVVTNDQVKTNYPGTPEQSTAGESLIDPTPSADDIPTFLRTVLGEAANGQWSETGMGGRPSNPKILNIWREIGFGNNGAWGTDQTAWCMGFVNYVLKNTGYRFVQTARANDIRDRASAYGAQSIPLDQGQPGDIGLWSYSHVNFIYTGSNGRYTFVGGNQSDKAKNANNPSGGSVTQSWPSGYRTPGNGSLVSIWRPVKK